MIEGPIQLALDRCELANSRLAEVAMAHGSAPRCADRRRSSGRFHRAVSKLWVLMECEAASSAIIG